MSHRKIEPRFYPRAELEVPVILEARHGRSEARLLNISEGGALVAGAPLYPRGDQLDLTFNLPGQGQPINAGGTVVRSTVVSLAVSFNELSESELVAIRCFVDAHEPMVWGDDSPLPHALAVRFIPIIRRQAKRMARRLPSEISADDLIGAGFLALVESSQRFDPSTGTPFEPFALIRIRGAMLDEIRGTDPVSRGMRRRKAEVDVVARRLTGLLGRPPDDEEIASHLDLSLDDYRACIAAVSARYQLPIDDFGDARDSTRPPVQILPAGLLPQPQGEAEMEHLQRLKRVGTALAAIPPRLRSVLEMYFGDELTMREVGGVLGLTEGRISQLVNEGIGLVRAKLARSGDPDLGHGQT